MAIMIKLSVVIITLNEEVNIARCLQSVKDIADEIIVVDSMSTDNTTAIARSLGATVIDKAFDGYVKQRSFADDCASNNWVLAIDADEVLTPELGKSIMNVKQNPVFNAYTLSRLNNYCGKWIKHAGWYPDRKLRLYDKTKGTWHGEMIHEHWKLQNIESKVGKLNGDLLHYSYNTISDHIKQIEKFTELSSRVAVKNGKDCSTFKIWIGPKWTYFSMYILKLGFLDGYYGALLCKLSAFAILVKYSKIRQYAQMKRENKLY
jgi:glycosyltransferase involved in cell wall biosynthesis